MTQDHREQVDLKAFKTPGGAVVPPSEALGTFGWGVGCVEIDCASTDCLAKLEVGGRGLKSYSLRFLTRGGRARLFNHLEDLQDGLSRVSPETGRPHFQFMKVSEEAFTQYLKFLKTDNPTYYNLADRSV